MPALRRLPSVFLLLVLLAPATPAPACPVCDDPTGRLVRAALTDADFTTNLTAAVLPFAVFMAVVAVLHFAPTARRGAPTEREDRR
jgi:hypothetical protein